MKKEMAAGLVIEDRRLLLVLNIKHGKQRYEPPGGKKHEGECLSDTVVREAHEELGIRLRPKRLLGVYETQSPEGEFSVSMYICEVVSGRPSVRETEKIGGFGWYGLDELKGLREEGVLVPNLVSALEDVEPLLK